MSSVNSESAPMQDLNDSGCVQDSSVCENGYRGQAQLLDLSDDVLLYILQYCSPMDLKALGYACSRLGVLICDHTLWHKVDCRDSNTGQRRLQWFLTHCLCKDTTELKLKGYVDTQNRCLGTRDPCGPYQGKRRLIGLGNNVFELATSGGPGMDSLLLGRDMKRMWYPHLPRYTVTPRWPDQSELDKAAKEWEENSNQASTSKNSTSNKSQPSSSKNACSSKINCKPGSSKMEADSNQASTSNSVAASSNSQSSNSEDACSSNMDSNPGPSKMEADSNQASTSTYVAASSNSQPSSSHQTCSSKMDVSNIDVSIDADLNKASTSNGVATSSKSYLNSNQACSSKTDTGPSRMEADSSGFNKPSSSKDVASSSTAGTSLDEEAADTDIMDCGFSCPGPQFTLTAALLRDLNATCSNLTSLFLEYCNIDYKTNNISQFPKTLKKLSLKGTRCYNQPLHTSYLCKIQDHLPDLEFLDVSSCDWFEPASLMPVSKCPSLRQLVMCRCARLTECVAYASLAARYGFRRLKVLDARESPLADSEVSALGWLPCLEELYVSPPVHAMPPLDHTHVWREPLPPFHELSQWEDEEPEYYKMKYSDADSSEEDKIGEEDAKGVPNNGIAEIRDRDTMVESPWGSFERRRVIVIQPNANREMIVRSHEVPVELLPLIPGAGPSKRPSNDVALDLVKRPRLNEGANENANLNQGGNNDRDELNVVLAEDSRYVLYKDLNRVTQHNQYCDLVTDSAVFRLGRGENERIIYIGAAPQNEVRTKNEKSNLRVLSITGFRHITDRSLYHLATAAPHLRLLDFSETSVTTKGVEMFKAVQPKCEVRYSKFMGGDR